jgi:tripartite ATP-independent transporter DctM subunit
MEWYAILLVSFSIILLLMGSGLPVFVSFFFANVAGVLLVIGPRGFGMFSNSVYDTLSAENFATVPLFILMGEILFRSGSVEVLSKAVDVVVGKVRGRMYLLVIVLSTIFGALSGSAVAVAAMLGRSLLPQMSRMGYDSRLSSSTILAGASLAPIIPPSVLVVVIGSLVTNVSIAGLLIAGIIPGLIVAFIFAVYVGVRVFMNPDLAPKQEERPQVTAGDVIKAIISTLPFGLVIFSVMGLILLGIATPSEAAAAGVLGAVLTALVYKRFTFAMVWSALKSAATISAMILLIVASSKLFGQLLSFSGATPGLIRFISELQIDPMIMLLLLMLVPLILCMFMDQFAFMLLAIPLYEPILKAYGFDPLWFWTLFLINLTIGSITPPFGYTLFALKGVAQDLSIRMIYSSAWPTVIIFLSSLVLFALVPSLITFLPNLLN